MILEFSATSPDVTIVESLDRCNALEVPIDISKMSAEGWASYEYDIVFSRNLPLPGSHQNSYMNTFDVTTKDDNNLETTHTAKIWINFIPKI